MSEKGKPEQMINCPLRSTDTVLKQCLGHCGLPTITCAWWIPGAECCAIVQIARKLHNLAAAQTVSVNNRLPREDRIPF